MLPPAALVSDEDIPAGDEENPAKLTDDPPKAKRTWWSIIWKMILTAVCAFFIALFIKGFIDAKDVDVSR